ncbi:rhodanese-related sulfurtransferase [Alkalihalobacillus sp. R86527]|uniref:oxygen-dependent tRNA uridine(34) hydroxylase TrhO n=1 Tax=Alkalihalobacillus sp. R86527 TaxID=3093863 RepID=UPI003671208B
MQSEASAYQVLLFYKYVEIEDPEYFARKHLKFCESIDLKGRVLIGKEGINGTVSGPKECTEQYMKELTNDPRFADIEFKIDDAESHTFKKMHVRARNEIVSLRLDDDIDPNETTGNYLEPKEFMNALESGDVIVIDARNDYEYDIGHFRNAIRPNIKAFRELPEWIEENLSDQKDKKVLTYCTGGIRCEKFSGYLKKKGFNDVSQLHGGIVTYGKDPDVQGKYFDGKCFVFDDRLAVDVNQTDEATVVGKCYHCGTEADMYINCTNVQCDKLHIVCDDCLDSHQRYCSSSCKEISMSHQ